MGLLIAIEGVDGSGKGTQAAHLLQNLRARGVRTELFSFPRYRDTQFGQKIGDYLNGRFGSLEQVSPFLVSLLFAGDRFESRDCLMQALAENDLVLCDRYTASNIAHQAAKVTGAERDELISWIHHVEHGLYALPRPDRTLLLDVPVRLATQLISMKGQRNYTDRAADLQEADASYLQNVYDVYMHLAATQTGWVRIDCSRGNDLKAIDEISREVSTAVRELMA